MANNHPAYVEQVRQIAPEYLRDREVGLAELARFCTEPDQEPYAWWQARPGRGSRRCCHGLSCTRRVACGSCRSLSRPGGVRRTTVPRLLTPSPGNSRTCSVRKYQHHSQMRLGTATCCACFGIPPLYARRLASALCSSWTASMRTVAWIARPDTASQGSCLRVLRQGAALSWRVVLIRRYRRMCPTITCCATSASCAPLRLPLMRWLFAGPWSANCIYFWMVPPLTRTCSVCSSRQAVVLGLVTSPS